MAGFRATEDEEETAILPPGFRFHPTDEELVTHYLSPKILNHSFTTKVIGDVDLNRVEPWDLPWKAKMGEKEWYFFCLRDRKYPTGSRTNRATESGYWKATGKDKEILRGKTVVGMKKTLVFYKGRAPRGEKTNWVIHEYRVEGNHLPKLANKSEWVISRVFKKTSGGKKVHISGLLKSRGLEADLPSTGLPPLTDLSSEEMTAAAEGSHVTCFSNFTDGNFPGGELEVGYLGCNGSLLQQDQSILRLVLENNGACMKQNAKTEFLTDVIGENNLPTWDDHEFPGGGGCNAFDGLFNYSLLGDGLLECGELD